MPIVLRIALFSCQEHNGHVQLNGSAAEALVAELLSQVGEVSTAATAADLRADIAVTTADGRRYRVEVKALSSISPVTVRRLALPRTDVDIRVVVAPRVSLAAARDLEVAGWSWASLDGRAHIAAPGLLLQVVHAKPKVVPTTDVPALAWTTTSRDVAERLLTYVPSDLVADRPLPLPPTATIADDVGHSQSRVATVMRAMAARGWLRKEGGQRGVGSRWTLIDPSALLDEWAEQQVPPMEVLAHGLIADPDTFVAGRLRSVLPAGMWALAGASAAERLAPILTATPVVEIAVPDAFLAGLDQVLPDLGLRRVERGHRVRFVAVRPVTVRTAQVVDGLPVTSDVRTYADLVTRPGRGAEAAAEVRRVRLAF
jgi:hypothetical protein